MARRSVDLTKKFPWNDDMRRPVDVQQAISQFEKKSTSGRANTHDGLQHNGHGDDTAKFVCELESILRASSIEGRIIVRLT